MNKYAIISDSSCNLNSKEWKELGIYEILPMHLYAGEKEFDADGDWSFMDAHEYYESMRNGVCVKSSQIIESEFDEVFRKCLSEGLDVLYLGCSSGLSKVSMKQSFVPVNFKVSFLITKSLLMTL